MRQNLDLMNRSVPLPLGTPSLRWEKTLTGADDARAYGELER
jgi:hypothetical protein